MLVDIFADGDLGIWALDSVDPAMVGSVITSDVKLKAHAEAKYSNVILGSPSTANVDPQAVALSIHYHHIFPPEYLSRYKHMYNLHPGFLPWGRGFFPVFWALWEGTPAGATLHEITKSVDQGPIVAQIRVDYSVLDTGWSLYQKVRAAEQFLFRSYWPRLIAGETLPSRSQSGEATYHRAADFFALKREPNLELLTAYDLVRLARALTFPGHSGIELRIDGSLYELQLVALRDA